MATSGKSNCWIKDYFTLRKNMATCNICNESYLITLQQKIDMMKHIKTVHSDQSTVSSEISQKDWEQFYTRQNNEIKCKFCAITYFEMNSTSRNIRQHLKGKHNVTENTAEKLCAWLRNHYNFDESDRHNEKQHCKYCNNSIPNKSLFLLKHLIGTHQTISVSPKIIPAGLSSNFLKFRNWIWEYFTKEEKHAKCCICGTVYLLKEDYSSIQKHIRRHKKDNDREVLSKNLQGNKKWPFSMLEDNQTKCDICDAIFPAVFVADYHMKDHLIISHNFNYTKANNLYIWLLYYHTLDFQTSNCKTCENIFEENKSFNIMVHFIKAHQIDIPLYLRPTLLSSSSSLSNSDNNEDAATSSYQQPTSSSDQNFNFDNVNDPIDLSLKIRPKGERKRRKIQSPISSRSFLNFDNDEDTATSSSY